MFQRPFKIKSNTVTRGSDRKHLKRKVCSRYDQVPQTLVEKLLPNKVAMATIRLATHSGGVATVYSVNDEPMFFEEDDRIYPTVYTIWQIPDFLPYVSTWPQVLPRLQGGADLMLPGVVTAERGGTSVEGVRRGQCCAINLVGQRSAVGVGVALMSCDQMLTNRMRGKGFRVVHLYGDHLWMMGSKLHPPVVTMETPIESPKEKPGEEDVGDNQEMFLEGGLNLLMTGDTHEYCGYSNTLQSDTDAPLANQITIDVLQDQLPGAISMETNLTSQIDALLLGSHTDPNNFQTGEGSSNSTNTETATDTNPDSDVAMQHIITTTGGEVKPDTLASYDSDSEVASKPVTVTAGVSEIAGLTLEVASTPGGSEDVELSQLSDPIEAMDALLMECFLHALKTNVTQSDLPLLTSTFYRTHILQLCPSSQKLDIKKTSYKKLSRFLHEMEARGVVQIQELSKGVESVTNVDFKHAMVKGFVPKLLAEMPSSTPSTGATASTSDSKPLRVTELYMPSHKLQPIFAAAGYTKSSTLNQKDVRDIVTGYVRLNELTSKDKPGLVTLDPILCDAVHKRGEATLAQLSWQKLMERVLEEMRPAYMISDGNGSPVVRKGKLQPITLTLAQRTGNKKVTLVDNLEVYGISPGELGRTMQRLAAASATVNDLPGRTDTHQLLVQGNAVKILARMLQESYGVPLKYIEAIDKIKPAKKMKSSRR